MIVVLNTFIFQMVCIVLFTLVYFTYQDNYSLPRTFLTEHKSNESPEIDILDCLYTSVTIQAGVGYNGMDPLTHTGKILIICQQVFMICANMIIFYIFTKHIFQKI